MATTYTGATNPFQVTTGSNLNGTVTEFGAWSGSLDVDNLRRKFGIGDYVAQLAPEQSLFFAYLSRVAKKPLDETVWKPLEYRPQWQRRNFTIKAGSGTGDIALTEAAGPVSGKKWTLAAAAAGSGTAHPKVNYDASGKMTTTWDQDPIYMLVNQIIRLKVKVTSTGANAGTAYHNFKILSIHASGALQLESVKQDNIAAAGGGAAVELIAYDDDDNVHEGQVVGSAFGEATTAPDGWVDKISDAEFYMQIFKTAVPLMSGSAQATRYRGFSDEYQRIYTQHVMSHKMDIENAMLFGSGSYVNQDTRNSWGIVPFIELMGGKAYTMNASSDGFDAMVDIMENFFAPEVGNSGQKLCLTSRKVIAWLSKLGSATSGSFLYNSLGKDKDMVGATAGTNASSTNPYSVSMDVKGSKFAPVPITAITTAFGTFNFVAHPLFRGHAENLCAVIDLANVAYRPLVGNGLNRDTFVETNIQDNSVDGRKDQIITECGLEVMLPETHALITFSNL
tara:strand:+ start:1872 stop:3392 length:1521 start_codon:yes stop_codon:yes gene_type:complete